MCESYRMSKSLNNNSREFVVYGRHKGFIRLAMQQGASIVPVICFNEIDQFDCLMHTPNLWRKTFKIIGFPFPFIMCGCLRFPFSFLLPLPKSTSKPLTFVLGQPFDPLDAIENYCVDGGEGITEEQVPYYYQLFKNFSEEYGIFNTGTKNRFAECKFYIRMYRRSV